jgi:hypothetical protein
MGDKEADRCRVVFQLFREAPFMDAGKTMTDLSPKAHDRVAVNAGQAFGRANTGAFKVSDDDNARLS